MLDVSVTARENHGAVERIRLLHVEDDALLVANVGRALRNEGFDVDAASDAAEALALVERREYPLALLDWRLPGSVDGLEFARWLRVRSPGTGILMLSGVASMETRRRALEEVCDDCLVKPCDLGELLARLRALRRRTTRMTSPIISWGPFRVDLIGNRVWIEDREIEKLQPLQTRFLAYMVSNAGRICTHGELNEMVFGGSQRAGSTSRARVISVLRARCGRHAGLIVTADGVGYGVGAR